MGRKVVFAALVAVLAVGVGAWVFIGLDDNGNEVDGVDQDELATETSDGSDIEADIEVVYDGSSFSPSEVTINSGDAVAFINESDFGMWPASDPHPQHTDLPEFDSGRNLEPSGVYEFTFDEPGEWGYHNHTNSTVTGTVVVE